MAEEGDDDSASSADGTVVVGDRAPCFDNGVCLAPDGGGDDDDGGDGGDDRGGAPGIGAMRRLGPHSGPTVWSEFGRLARERQESGMDIANLGQGFPDWPPPGFAIQSLVSAATGDPPPSPNSPSSPHQYTRTAGHPALVRQLARRYSRHMDRVIDPMNEVAVTVGASQALYLCLQTLVDEPGRRDEVVLFEPFFDLYANQIRFAGGTPVYVPLTFVPPPTSSSGRGGVGGGGTWILEPEKLREKVGSRTCAVILNSPHNPTGKVFTHAEMLSISRIVSDDAGPGCVVISDEVYKYIVHSPPVDDGGGGDGIGTGGTTSACPGPVHFASLPGMWDRTITVSSAGKTFSATGWQVGWCVGPSRLISPVHSLLPYVQFCASTVMQEALARTLPRADEPYMGYGSYYGFLNEKYRRKRDMLATALRDAGFEVPDYENDPGWGGFFIFARITDRVRRALPLSRLEAPYRANPAAPGGTARLDWALCQWMAEEVGVLCIPAGPFFSRERATEGASDEFIRVAFCKTDETIEQAAVALRGLTSSLAGGGSDYDEDEEEEEEDANIASGKEAAAESSLVDEDVVMNRMG